MNFLKNVSTILLGFGIGILIGMVASLFVVSPVNPATVVMFALGLMGFALGMLGHALRVALLDERNSK